MLLGGVVGEGHPKEVMLSGDPEADYQFPPRVRSPGKLRSGQREKQVFPPEN